MFSDLKHKLLSYILKLTLPVIFAMLAMLFSMYIYYISKDFGNKSEVFHSQISNTVAAKISQIENTLDIIIKRNRLYEMPSENFELRTKYNSIYSINTYCIEVTNAFLNYGEKNSLYLNTESKNKFSDFTVKYKIDNRTKTKSSCWTYIDNYGWLCTKAIYSPDNNEKIGYITVTIDFDASNIFSEINSSFCSGYGYYMLCDGYVGKIYTGDDTEVSASFKKALREASQDIKPKNYRRYKMYSDGIFDNIKIITTVKCKYFADIASHLGAKLVVFFMLISALCLLTAKAFTKRIVTDISVLCKNIDSYMDGLDNSN